MRSTILYAEDERGIRRFVEQELQAAGYRVVLTVDGVEALETIDTSVVDLVIVDEHMPRANGLETAQRIKLLDPTLPVILFTADPAYEQCTSPYIDAAILKSEDLTRLKSEVAALLVDEMGPAAVSPPNEERRISK